MLWVFGGFMSSTIEVVNVSIPFVGADGSFIDYTAFTNFCASIANLCSDKRSHQTTTYAYDQNGNYVGEGTDVRFLLLSANQAAAITLYNTYVATLAAGTIVPVWYSVSTYGS
jgi:hypothetical protein